MISPARIARASVSMGRDRPSTVAVCRLMTTVRRFILPKLLGKCPIRVA
jgi:hypothetical protein